MSPWHKRAGGDTANYCSDHFVRVRATAATVVCSASTSPARPRSTRISTSTARAGRPICPSSQPVTHNLGISQQEPLPLAGDSHSRRQPCFGHKVRNPKGPTPSLSTCRRPSPRSSDFSILLPPAPPPHSSSPAGSPTPDSTVTAPRAQVGSAGIAGRHHDRPLSRISASSRATPGAAHLQPGQSVHAHQHRIQLNVCGRHARHAVSNTETLRRYAPRLHNLHDVVRRADHHAHVRSHPGLAAAGRHSREQPHSALDSRLHQQTASHHYHYAEGQATRRVVAFVKRPHRQPDPRRVPRQRWTVLLAARVVHSVSEHRSSVSRLLGQRGLWQIPGPQRLSAEPSRSRRISQLSTVGGVSQRPQA